MAKKNTQYVCQNCGASYSKWSGRCPNCQAWDTLVETAPTIGNRRRSSAKPLETMTLKQLQTQALERIPTGMAEVDVVLGGGIVPGAVMLLSGDPGIGKSTLVLQLATLLGSTHKVLYVSGEESADQVQLRARRLPSAMLDFDFVSTIDIDGVLATVADGNYDLLIIDSIQTMNSGSSDSAAGSISQITNNTQAIIQVAKASSTAVFVIGHVTKEGNVAGPKLMEHLVDTVLYLEGERFGNLKVLRAIKNRFGSVSEVGIFEMGEHGLMAVANPSAVLLAERQNNPGSVIFPAIEGARAVLVEVQALVADSVFGYPKRTAVGVDLNRLNLLCALISRRGGINLSSRDVYVNIVGGLKVVEPAVDLAIIMAIASSVKNIALDPKTIVYGEVGLGGEIRSVTRADLRLAEAKKLGFSRGLAPAIKANPKLSTIRAAIATLKN